MHSMDKKYGVVFLAVAVIVLLFFVLNMQSDAIAVKVHTIEETTDLYELHVEYPQFTKVDEEFNEKIQEIVNNSVDSFKKEALSQDVILSSPSNQPIFLYTLGWTSAQINNEIISFVIEVSHFTGGAHGSRELYTFSYNVKEDREITLSEVFSNTPRYLDRVAQYVMSDLKAQLTAQSGGEPNAKMLYDGASPDLTNYSHFTIGPGEMITFYFEEYQVAAYAAGQQKVVMPISFIRSTTTNE
jgi:hypothetical protein